MKVIFDTDPGIDDAMALLYLHRSARLDLVAITTILGNASIDQCTNNALFLCEKFDIAAPVYRGADRSIDGSLPEMYPDFVHGKNGLGEADVTVKARRTEPEDAVTALRQLTAHAPGEITIIAVGRLTNLALAIEADPGFASGVRNIIAMGGAVHVEGNVTPYAEANIIGDPEAAKVVFDSGIPLTLVGLDVTLVTRITTPYLEMLCTVLGELGPLVDEINQVYRAYYKTSQNWDDFPVHDSSAVACANDPTLFRTARGRLDCRLEGEERGRTVFAEEAGGPHEVCLAVDSERLLGHYLDTVRRAPVDNKQ